MSRTTNSGSGDKEMLYEAVVSHNELIDTYNGYHLEREVLLSRCKSRAYNR